MTTEQIIALIATGVVGMLGFFLRSSFNSITARLDKLEGALVELLAELRASNTTSKVHSEEIALLRQRQHEMSQTLQILKSTQERCKKCRGED